MTTARSPSQLTFKNRAELWLAGAIRRYCQATGRTLEPHQPAALRCYPIGVPGAPVTAPIPRVVWTYWNSPTLPLLVERCIANWRQVNPGFEIRVLDDAALREYVPDAPDALARVAPAKRSDWIRLRLLRDHGGIWIDASTILTQSLDWVIEAQQRECSDLVAYYLGRFTTDADCPVVESWFLAAPPGSRFAADAFEEFNARAINRTGEQYIDCLREEGVFDLVRQNIDAPDYLSIHLAMQYVMRKRGGYRLCLSNAEDGPFQYHVLGQWRRTPLKLRLLFSRVAGELPPVIKLRGPDRRRLDDYLGRGLYLPDSVVGRLLMADHTH
ncbi:MULTISPECIES: capsular polysaccharide synthesis protein [unclassified Acidovorax]|uniref:glycosyltransferase family 32 protein n=1 Tax=unclassified Acidovorax TaxID=2684926 RepID=UPI0028834A9E|nr:MULTISPECIES: capsular polysaccharide synthesis protein [unclassified Acidovorax]